MTTRQAHEHDGPPDDLDRLFARLPKAAVPVELTARVLTSTTGVVNTRGETRAMRWAWLALASAAVLVLAVAGYALGATLAAGEGLELLAALAAEPELLVEAPLEVLLALAEAVPWPPILLAGVVGAVLADTARRFQAPGRGVQPARLVT